MTAIDIYFNNKIYERIHIDNVIMQEVIGEELIVLFKTESYDYNHTEVKHFPMNIIDYFLVRGCI